MVKNFNLAWLAVTYDCQNRCSWCYASENLDEYRGRTFPEERIADTLDLLKELGIGRTTLIGGEPTLYKHLPRLLEEHSIRGIKTGLVTNGRKLANPDFCKFLKKQGVESLTVSIEGYDAQSHDSLTNAVGSYEEAIKGIYEANGVGIAVATNTVISKSSLNNLERILDSLIDKPLRAISFNVCGPCLTGEDNSEMIKPFYAAKKFEEIYKHAKSRGKIIGLVTPMPLCFFEEDFREELVKNRSLHGGPCQLSSGSNFVVDYNGDILPCTHMTGFPVGNIFTNENVLKKENFLEMYNSPEEIPSKFREKMSRTASTKCDAPKCDQSCTGGCPLIWKVFDPEEEIPGIELQKEWDKVAKD